MKLNPLPRHLRNRAFTRIVKMHFHAAHYIEGHPKCGKGRGYVQTKLPARRSLFWTR